LILYITNSYLHYLHFITRIRMSLSSISFYFTFSLSFSLNVQIFFKLSSSVFQSWMYLIAFN
jgi:hypothetical protein